MATDYEVTGQRQVDKLNDQGGFDPTMEVTFRVIPENVIAMVPILMRNLEPDFVRSAIEQRVAAIKSIAAL